MRRVYLYLTMHRTPCCLVSISRDRARPYRPCPLDVDLECFMIMLIWVQPTSAGTKLGSGGMASRLPRGGKRVEAAMEAAPGRGRESTVFHVRC